MSTNDETKLTFVGNIVTVDSAFLSFLNEGDGKVWFKVNGINKNKMTICKDNYSVDVDIIDGVVQGDRFLVDVETRKVLKEELAKRVKRGKNKGSTPPFGMKIRY